MDIIAQAETALDRPLSTISRLQSDAWAAWNSSYSAEDRAAYQAVSRELYRQDVHERIISLIARSEEQNQRLDALLAARAQTGKCRKRTPAARSARAASRERRLTQHSARTLSV